MATEVLRLGMDTGGLQRGARGARGAIDEVRTASKAATVQLATMASRITKVAAVVGGLGLAFAALAGAYNMGAGIRGFVEFDHAMTQSLAIMGDVSVAMREDMAEAARRVGEELNFAATEGAEAFFYLASAGLSAEKSIAALPAVAQFARAGMFDFATATDLATDAQSALGLTSADAQENLRNMVRVTDTLVEANTLANATVQQFSESLTNRAGAAIKSFNRDIEEGVAVLAAYADQGIKGAEAGTNFSRVLRLLATAAVNNQKEMEALNLDITDADGNLIALSEIVGQLEDSLLGMSDTTRTAALESIGFQARVQDAILPLLGMSDAIATYEEKMRVMSGTTKEVSDKQMLSLQNRIGQLRQEFVNWRTELAEDVVPALEWTVENIDKVTDAAIALAIAVGAAGLTGIFLAFGPAILSAVAVLASLVVSINSVSAAIALLQMAIGPVGWVVLGITAITTLTYKWIRANREAREAVEAHAEGMSTLVDQIGSFDRATTSAALHNYTNRLYEAQDAVQAIKDKLAEVEANKNLDRFAKDQLSGSLNKELDVANAHMEDMQKLVNETAIRWTEFGDAAEEAMEPLKAVLPEELGFQHVIPDLLEMEDGISMAVDRVDDLKDQIKEAKFALAFADGAETADKLTQSLEAMGVELGRINDALEVAVAQWLKMNEIDFSGMQIPGQDPRIHISPVRMSVPGLISEMRNEKRGMNWSDEIDKTVEALSGLQIADQVTRSVASLTQSFTDIPPAAQNALRGISDVIGGLQGIKGGGTLGMITGTAGIIGGIVGLVDGIMGASKEAERQLREATARWEQGLEELGRMFTDSTWMEDAQRQIDDALLASLNMIGATIEGFNAPTLTELPDMAELEKLRKTFEDLAAAGGKAGEFGRKGVEWLDKVAEAIGAAGDAAERAAEQFEKQQEKQRENVEIEIMRANGMDKWADMMEREIERRDRLAAAVAAGDTELQRLLKTLFEIEDAARKAAEAEEEDAKKEAKEASRDSFISDLDRLILENTGDELAIFMDDIAKETEDMIDRAQGLLDDGIIDQATFDAWVEAVRERGVLALEEFTEATEAAAKAAREAAEAERFRAAMDTENLRVRLLMMQGHDREAMKLRQNIELMEAVQDGRDGEYIRLLQMIHAEELRAAALDKSRKATEETTEAANRLSRVLSQPTGLRLSLLRWRFAGQTTMASMAGGQSGGSSVPVPSGGSSQFQEGPVVNQVSGGSTAQSAQSPSRRSGGRPIVIHVHPAKGESEREVAYAVKRVFKREKDAGVIDPEAIYS